MIDSPRAAFGVRLRELRDAAALTQAAIARRLGVSEDAVGTWERGRSLPDDERTAGLLDTLLGAEGDLLARWERARGWRPDRSAVGSGVGPSDPTVRTMARDSAAFGRWAEQLSSGEVAITDMSLRARALADAALTAPPGELLGDVADLARESFALARGHHRPSHGLGLYAVAAQATALLAWLCGDLGALDAARTHAATAQVCAEYADQPDVSAWVAAVRSKTLFWCGLYSDAAAVAERGLGLRAPGTANVMLACQMADAYDRLGAVELVAAAVQRAEDEAQRVRGVDALGGLFSCPPGRHANYASGCLLGVGDIEGSLAEAERALEEFGAGAYGFGTIAQVRVNQVETYLAARDLEGAAAAARPVLDLPPDRRLATVTQRLRPLAAALNRPALRGPQAAALREEMAEYCRAGTQRALGPGAASSTED
jgi:transcriptional regulator with XRE-family HTH domain